ncbi:MAG: carboxylesterase family protein [Steroidobacteraceae bacterium]
MKQKLIATIWGLAAAALGTAAAAAAAAPLTVRTSDGALEGVMQGETRAFLGVPFAAPPVGGNRWRAPQPPAPWKGTRPARQFGASCMQPWPAPHFGPYTSEFVDVPPVSEDCLFLNVWTPASPTGALPVLVWIHGGGFGGGAGAVPIYDGGRLAARGIVVVTLNYRVGPFGFLAHPQLSAQSPRHTSGNYGILDQIAALQWVKHNIANFGGDPGQVTIAGQSAGAISVNALRIAPAAAGLFQRAIAQSGSGMGVRSPALAEAEHAGQQFAAWLGATDVAALRALPAQKIQTAVFMPFDAPRKNSPPPIRFQTTVDGLVLPSDPEDPAARVITAVPLLTGFTADENFMAAAHTSAEFEKAVRARFGSHADRLLALYPHASDAQAAASLHTLERDRCMTSLLLWSHEYLRHNGTPLFLYRFDHAPPDPSGSGFGAFHTAEVPYLFGTLDPARRAYGDADRAISRQLQDHWLAFMRQGEPGSTGPSAWSRATATGTTVMRLGDAPGSGQAVSTPERLDALLAYHRDGGALGIF